LFYRFYVFIPFICKERYPVTFLDFWNFPIIMTHIFWEFWHRNFGTLSRAEHPMTSQTQLSTQTPTILLLKKKACRRQASQIQAEQPMISQTQKEHTDSLHVGRLYKYYYKPSTR
jgi:hypothetical protein